MRITIQAFPLQGFNLAPETEGIFLRVYALRTFIASSDDHIVQPKPFYEEWKCARDGTELDLPEIILESTIDALSPTHPEGLRYYAGFFDEGGHQICTWLSPFALDINPNPTTWAHIVAYNSPGVEFDWTTEHADHYSKEEFDALLDEPMPGAVTTVLPPLDLDGTTLSIPRASASQDGYLAADDWLAFSGGTGMGVTSFNLRTGEVVLLDDDVLAALGYAPTLGPMPFIQKAGDTMTGALVLPGNPTLDPQAAPKQYVDARVLKAGDTMTGPLVLSADPTVGSPPRQAATKEYVDGHTGGSSPAGAGTELQYRLSGSALAALIGSSVDMAGARASLQKLSVTVELQLRDTDTIDYPVSIDAADSGGTGFRRLLVPNRATAFNPGTLTELKAWYKTPFGSHANGDVLTTWPDSSSHGNDLTFSGSGATYAAAFRSGLDAVAINGGVTTADSPSIATWNNSYSIFVACQQGFDTTAGGGLGLIEMVATNTVVDMRGYGGVEIIGASGTAPVNVAFFNSPGPVTVFHIADAQVQSDGVCKAGTNGVYGTPVPIPGGDTPFVSSAIIRLFHVVGSTYWGTVGEILVCSPQPSPTNITAVINYLKTRWAVM